MKRLIAQVIESSPQYQNAISFEEYQDRVIALESQHPDYEKDKRIALAKVELLNTSRNIRHTGRATDGTFLMMSLAVENLDEEIQIDEKLLEGAEPDQAHQIVEEGIFDSIRNTMTGWKEAYQNSKADQLKTGGQFTKDVQNQAAALAEIKERFGKVTTDESGEVDITKLSGWFVMKNHLRKETKFPSDLIGAILSDKKKLAEEVSKVETSLRDMAKFLENLYTNLDYSSDAAFEKTYMKRIGEFRKICMGSIYPPGTYVPLLGQGVIFTSKNNQSIFDEKDNVEWMRQYVMSKKSDDPMLVSDRDTGPEVKLTFKQSDVKALIESTEKSIQELAKVWPSNGRAPMYVVLDVTYEWFVKSYQLEKKGIGFNGRQANFDGLNDENVNYLKRTIAGMPAIAYADRALYYGLVIWMADRVRYQLQLLNRILKGFGA